MEYSVQPPPHLRQASFPQLPPPPPPWPPWLSWLPCPLSSPPRPPSPEQGSQSSFGLRFVRVPPSPAEGPASKWILVADDPPPGVTNTTNTTASATGVTGESVFIAVGIDGQAYRTTGYTRVPSNRDGGGGGGGGGGDTTATAAPHTADSPPHTTNGGKSPATATTAVAAAASAAAPAATGPGGRRPQALLCGLSCAENTVMRSQAPGHAPPDNASLLMPIPFAHPIVLERTKRCRCRKQLPSPIPTPTIDGCMQMGVLAPAHSPRGLEPRGSDVLRFIDGTSCIRHELQERALLAFLRDCSLDRPVRLTCPHTTATKCMSVRGADRPCADRAHFERRLNPVTDVKLGDCSYLDGCYNYDSCPFVHYTAVPAARPPSFFEHIRGRMYPHQVEVATSFGGPAGDLYAGLKAIQARIPPYIRPKAQWMDCDIMKVPLQILGKFDIILMDPPWPIHMKLPYQQLSDEEIVGLNIPCLQDDGLIFLWITNRALEAGIDCLKNWGYVWCDIITWVKTNQIGATIATGRTGHWLNHMKEMCLVGIKGRPRGLNCGLDGSLIVEKIRETSRKPDLLYRMIERLSPHGRKLELFGRKHNLRHGWITLGNQLPGSQIDDPVLSDRWVCWCLAERARKASARRGGMPPPPPPQFQTFSPQANVLYNAGASYGGYRG